MEQSGKHGKHKLRPDDDDLPAPEHRPPVTIRGSILRVAWLWPLIDAPLKKCLNDCDRLPGQKCHKQAVHYSKNKNGDNLVVTLNLFNGGRRIINISGATGIEGHRDRKYIHNREMSSDVRSQIDGPIVTFVEPIRYAKIDDPVTKLWEVSLAFSTDEVALSFYRQFKSYLGSPGGELCCKTPSIDSRPKMCCRICTDCPNWNPLNVSADEMFSAAREVVRAVSAINQVPRSPSAAWLNDYVSFTIQKLKQLQFDQVNFDGTRRYNHFNDLDISYQFNAEAFVEPSKVHMLWNSYNENTIGALLEPPFQLPHLCSLQIPEIEVTVCAPEMQEFRDFVDNISLIPFRFFYSQDPRKIRCMQAFDRIYWSYLLDQIDNRFMPACLLLPNDLLTNQTAWNQGVFSCMTTAMVFEKEKWIHVAAALAIPPIKQSILMPLQAFEADLANPQDRSAAIWIRLIIQGKSRPLWALLDTQILAPIGYYSDDNLVQGIQLQDAFISERAHIVEKAAMAYQTSSTQIQFNDHLAVRHFDKAQNHFEEEE